jgi:hypothetical protein
LADSSATNEIQSLSISAGKGRIALSNGGSVLLNDSSATNELQTLIISNDSLFISKGNGIRLSDLSQNNSGVNSANNSTIKTNSANNFSVISNMDVPDFLNYYGNGLIGKFTATNSTIFSNNSAYSNLIIPTGVTAKITPSIRTIIYVKDTLFLYGTIDGSGNSAAAVKSNNTVNQLGASASGCEWSSSNSSPTDNGVGGATQAFSWEANQLPKTFSESFSGSISKKQGTNYYSMGNCNSAANGENLTVDELKKFVCFGVNFSGYNGVGPGQSASSSTGGQGGACLYIIARNIVFNGKIKLNGGNGQITTNSSGFQINRSAGGGGGSCVIRTSKIINQTGTFEGIGGSQATGSYSCKAKGGDGSMIIIN